MFLFSLLVITMLVSCVQMNNGDKGKGKGKGKKNKSNRDFVGVFDFSFGSEPLRLHICEDRDTNAIYWGCVIVQEDGSERTIAVGRDPNGAETLSKSETQIAGDMFHLFGSLFSTIGAGSYSITYDSKAKEHTLVVNFPDQGIVDGTVVVHKQKPGKGGKQSHRRLLSRASSSSHKHKHSDDSAFAMTEEYRCFMPYASTFDADDFPLAAVSVDADTPYTVGDKGTRLSTYAEETQGVECFEDAGGRGTTELMSVEWEGRLVLFKYSADDQTREVCANGYVMQVRVAEDLIMSAMECEDAAGIGVQDLLVVDHSDASWHQCPIGN